MRPDWLIFTSIMLISGYPWFIAWLWIERHLPAQTIVFLGQNGYLLWAIVTIPSAITTFFVWRAYCAFMYGWGSARLAMALCAACPLILSNDKKIATVLKVAPGLVDAVVFGTIAALVVILLFGNFRSGWTYLRGLRTGR